MLFGGAFLTRSMVLENPLRFLLLMVEQEEISLYQNAIFKQFLRAQFCTLNIVLKCGIEWY